MPSRMFVQTVRRSARSLARTPRWALAIFSTAGSICDRRRTEAALSAREAN